MDATRTQAAAHTSRGTRQANRQRQAERNLADLAFSQFMREHNARLDRIAAKAGA